MIVFFGKTLAILLVLCAAVCIVGISTVENDTVQRRLKWSLATLGGLVTANVIILVIVV